MRRTAISNRRAASSRFSAAREGGKTPLSAPGRNLRLSIESQNFDRSNGSERGGEEGKIGNSNSRGRATVGGPDKPDSGPQERLTAVSVGPIPTASGVLTALASGIVWEYRNSTVGIRPSAAA